MGDGKEISNSIHRPLTSIPRTLSGAAQGAEEGGDAGGVLAAGGRLDAAGDVDHPGLDAGDPLGDVLRREAAGQDQAGQGGETVEQVQTDRPAGAAGLVRSVGVDQDRVGRTAQPLGSSLARAVLYLVSG
jgi:hypothetical protein